ncbi:undecaprenyl/decaprenyl-phosphate alpha-N-acetylglucosaminyl 1-phosphate transferase [Acidimicrobiia bacterium]|nr:undecaprenyl/decaprenyl-phosphate alpha-N-acetylglucosaminyl 1-phosphate transferase [Acidimicrobiia bacterium]
MTLFQLPIFGALLFAITLSALLNKTVLHFTKQFKRQNDKGEKRLSNKNISPFGGIATSVAFFISTIFLGQADLDFITIGMCAVIISIIGIIDDIFNLDWKTKITGQIVAILYPLIKLDIFINIETFLKVDLQNYLNLILSLLWVLLIINSINFIDNMDGLTVVVSGGICLQIALLANYSNLYKVTDISLILLASLLGFFIFNYPPAKLYFGDSGTLFVGYVLGFISIIFDWTPTLDSILVSPFSPILFIFTVPILDFLIVTSDRINNHKSPTIGGTDHISHRLLNFGYSEKKVLGIFLLLSFSSYVLLIGTMFFSGVMRYISAICYLIFFIYNFIKYKKMEPLS